MCKPRKRRHASLTIRGAGSQPAPLVLYGCAPCRARSLIRALIALFVPTIGNLKPSSPLALDNDIAVPRAQFDLSNVSSGAVNLLGRPCDPTDDQFRPKLLVLRPTAADDPSVGLLESGSQRPDTPCVTKALGRPSR